MSEENSYLDSIPEQYREVPSIADAGSLENLLEQHVNLEQKMGTAVFKPADDADDESRSNFYRKVEEMAPGLTRIPESAEDENWNNVWNKLGRPAEAKDYELPEVKGIDGKPLSQDYVDDFRGMAHEIGMSKGQFSKVLEWFGQRTVDRQTASKAAYDETMGKLKSEWGDATEARIARAQKLVQEQGGEGALEGFGDIGNNPVVLQFLDKVADAMMEEGSLERQGPSGSAATRSAIEAEIAELTDRESYNDRRHRDHDRVVGRVNELYEKLEQYEAA